MAGLGAPPARAEGVPPELGLLVLLKVLTYDAGFEARVPSRDFVVLVPFAPGQADVAKSVVTAAHGLSIKAVVGRPLRVESVPVEDLEVQLLSRSAAAVLIPTGTPLELAKEHAAIASKHNRYSITLDEQLVRAGTTVGVALSGGKAQVILNVTAGRAIKAEFSSTVMRVARIQQ